LWFLARCLWRNDQAQKADTAWKDLIRARPRSTLVPGAKYWRARVLGLGGDHEGEKAALQDILKRHPISGHAWFAALRVGHQFEPIPHAAPPQWPASLATRPEVIRSEVLLQAGFRHWARAELVGILPAAKASGRAGALAAAWKLNEVGAYRAGKSLAKPYCTSAWRGGDPVAQQACTPMPEATIVERLTRQHGLVPYLPYGIMVAESALKPEVTSIAGARGLMQLMPAVAERLHTILYPDRAFVVEDLYSAPYNASLGTTELGHRTASLKDTLGPSSLPAVIASYNGGEKAVRRWIDALGDTNQSDEFAEDIGYTETRKYVRRVLGTIMAYRWTYGDPPQAKTKPSCTPTPSAGEPCEAAALCPLPGQWHSYL